MADLKMRSLLEYRTWLGKNAVARVIRGYLPTFLDGDTREFQVIVDDSLSPRTDGKTIWVSLIRDLLDDRIQSDDWMIYLQAITGHEAQHVNSSNFKDIEKIMAFGEKIAAQYNFSNDFGKAMAKEALNIVEDGRIENIAVSRRRGLMIPFLMLNQVIREGTRIKGAAKDAVAEYSDFWGNVLSYAKTGLYSPGIKAYAGTALESTFLSIEPLIDEGINARTSELCRKAVEKILEKVAPYCASLVQKPLADNSSSLESIVLQRMDGQPEYTSNSETEVNEKSTQPNSGNPLRKTKGRSGVGAGTGEDNTGSKKNEESASNPGEGAKGSTEFGKEQGSTMDSEPSVGFSDSDDEMLPIPQDKLDEVRKILAENVHAANKSQERENTASSIDRLSDSDINAIRALYTGHTVYFEEEAVQLSKFLSLPPELEKQGIMLRREIIKILGDKRKSQRGLRQGTMDLGALWKVGIGKDTVFQKRKDPQAGSCAFSLLIDNSASMAGSISGYAGATSKSAAARGAAAIIEHAVKGLIPCEIALFNQVNSHARNNVLLGYNERDTRNHTWSSITAIGPRGCNADSIHIRVAAEKLKRRREKKKIQIILSDGEPSAYSSRANGQMEVAEAVKASRRMGIILIAIMFGNQAFVESKRSTYERMYEKNIIACRPDEITYRLTALFRHLICR